MGKYLLILLVTSIPFCSYAQKSSSKDSVFTYVDQMPQLPAEMPSVASFLGANILYPEKAKEENIEGKVVIKFVVDEEGNVTDAQVIKGIGGGCDEEALRVVRSMPKWKPGKQNGQAVKVYFTLPIVFKLEDGNAAFPRIAFHSQKEIELYKDGLELNSARKYEDAISSFRKASALNVNNPAVYMQWAISLQKLNKMSEMAVLADKAYTTAKRNDTLYKLYGPGTINMLMFAYCYNRNYDKGLQVAQSAINRLEDAAYIKNEIARIQQMKEMSVKSDAELKKMACDLQNRATNFPAILELGMRYDAKGYKTEAFLLYTLHNFADPIGSLSMTTLQVCRHRLERILSGRDVANKHESALQPLDILVNGLFAGNVQGYDVLVSNVAHFVNEFNVIAPVRKDDYLVKLYAPLMREIEEKKFYKSYFSAITYGFSNDSSARNVPSDMYYALKDWYEGK